MQRVLSIFLVVSVACLVAIGSGTPALAQCTVPDNGTGTVTLPPAGCAYLSPSEVHTIINGLPPGTTIQLAPIHKDFICGERNQNCSFPVIPGVDCDSPGGALGGERECSDSKLGLVVNGTGVLGSFTRVLSIPVFFETHVGPRTPGTTPQSFDTMMVDLQGQLPPGDPDFDLLRITGGNENGLPSPGHTTLTRISPTQWNVDSFFDITYRIDFVGSPGGQLAGMSGSTTATIRMQLGTPPCATDADCQDGNPCTIDRCVPSLGLCQHAPVNCDDGIACTADTCGASPEGTQDGCFVPDNGSGTVTLPPAGCEYLSPSDVHMILDGLPPGTTVQVAAIHQDFICGHQSGTPSICSFPPPIPGVDCDQPGGTLGGEQECSQSVLSLTLEGTGTLAGFSRILGVPAEFETHIGPRTPGQPIQSFDTDMFRLRGQLPPGDPDFDLLRIRAGTDFGLPSPGHTTLTRQPGGTWAVDSFFDITYEIEFVGSPGGALSGLSGLTTASVRMRTPTAPCVHTSTCDDGNPCTIDSCDPGTGQCVFTPRDCADGDPCTADSCNPATGACEHGPPCDDGDLCTRDVCHPAGTEGLPPGCVVPDNGSGSVTLPPAGCEYLSPDDVHEILDGLPAGTTIEVAAIHKDFICGNPAGTANPVCSFTPPPGVDCEEPGGTLGGDKECASSTLQLELQGTGTLSSFSRVISLPIGFETHIAPRAPGPVQSFDTDMFRLFGQITNPGSGDPDFDLLRIVGGTDFGLPSPGHTTLTQLPGGNWAVDSFFDITYRIDFVGKPGGALGGMSGSTTATIRMATGGPPCSNIPIDCDDNNPCTVDRCDPATGQCVHEPLDCSDGNPCTLDRCLPATGQCVHLDANCDDGNACTTDTCVPAPTEGVPPGCSVADNGGGTVTLPPAGCAYLSPDDVHEIIDGLPAGTTIQLGAIHRDFICSDRNPAAGGVCSFPPPIPGVDCDRPGGSFPGGEQECAESQLELTLAGTGLLGGFSRTIALPLSFETHVAARVPGMPVQSFDTDMFRMFGQISNPTAGDPDFDLLRIVAGTDFGLPSPGHTTLTQIGGGQWAVDSFFDITYRIDFVGSPGGALAGRSGSTTGTIRMIATDTPPCVHTPVDCDDDNPCTVDSCDPQTGECANEPIDCGDGNPCTLDRCDPASGQCVHLVASCDDGNACTVDSCVPPPTEGLPPGCSVPDNGGGTVTLPPAGCAYLSPDDVHEILDGLPAGTTIQFGAIHRDFICSDRAGTPGAGVCSFSPPIPGVDCDQPGGSFPGGEQECANSNLALTVSGTGMLAGFSRQITLPISFETHVAQRTPGMPVQSFDTDMFRLFGEITNPSSGDPDFDLLRITAGTDYGLPSPGHTTLTQLGGGQWAVDSFFDITYRIDFVGRPGGLLSGQSGSTTGTIRMIASDVPPCVHTPVNCDDGIACTADSCNPANGQCTHVGTPPGPVGPTLRFPNKTSFAWSPTPDATHWNSYRGSVPALGLMSSRLPASPYDHTCYESANAFGDGDTLSTAAANPPAGTAHYFLSSAENQCGESHLGQRSNGLERPNVTPCP